MSKFNDGFMLTSDIGRKGHQSVTTEFFVFSRKKAFDDIEKGGVARLGFSSGIYLIMSPVGRVYPFGWPLLNL